LAVSSAILSPDTLILVTATGPHSKEGVTMSAWLSDADYN